MEKSVWKKVITWGLILVITMSLTACGVKEGSSGGKDGKSSKANADQDNMVFSGEAIGLDVVKGNPLTYAFTDDKIYFLATEYPDEEESGDDESEEDFLPDPGISRIYSMNLDGSGITEVCEPALEETDTFIQKILFDQNKELLLCSSSYDRKTETQHFFVIRVDESGNAKERVELTEKIENGQNTYINDICLDEKDDYVIAGDQSVYVLDKSFKKIAQIRSNEGFMDSLAKTPDGRIVCCVVSDEGRACAKELDIDKGKFCATYDLGSQLVYGTDSLVSGRGDYDFYYRSNQGVFGYSLEDQASTQLIDYVTSDIDPDTSYGIVPVDSQTMIGTSWEGGSASLMLYKKTDALQGDEKITVTYGAIWGVFDEIKSAAIKFNKENDRYKIEFKDYSTEEDPQGKMIADLLSGDAPDILDLSYIQLEPYARKGVLEDLIPYLEKDELISKDDILPSVEKAMEIDGKLYYVSSSFNVKTVLAAKKDVGDRTGWTFEELKELLEEKGEGVRPFLSANKKDVLINFTHAGINDYIDWEKGTCRFNSDDFKAILELAGRGIDEEVEYSDEAASELELIKEGKVLFWDGYALTDYLQGFESVCGSDVTYIGYPCEDKNGSYFSMNNQFCISAKSKVKEGAWEFIRTFFSKEYQVGDGTMFSNPTNKDAFEMFMKTKTATKAYKDELGNRIKPVKDSYIFDEGQVKVKPLSEEEEKLYRDLIERTTKIVSFDDTILDIINEEAAGYFKGEKSLDETADIIQNRVTTYVNERL